MLRTARTLSSPTQRDVLRLLGASQLRVIEGPHALRWIPFDAHMALLGALREALGRTGYRSFCCTMVARSMVSPLLFAKQVEFAAQLLNAGHWPVLRVLPVAVPQIFRAAGRVEVHAETDSAIVVYDQLPAQFARGDVWTLIWLGTLDALAERALRSRGLTAEVVQVAHDEARGRFEWRTTVLERAAVRGLTERSG